MIHFKDVKDISCKEYFQNDQFACDIFSAKYSHTKENGEKETPAEVFYRVCSGLLGDTDYRDTCFSSMWEGWFRPGGSILQGVGSNMNISLANCTTVPLEGDTIEDIAKCDYAVMKCAAYRQGIGVDFSKLRPKDSPINNAAKKSTGVVNWINKIVDNGKYIGQLGRMPALLISLSDNHPDVFEFVTSKLTKGQIENANISVQVSDKFMEHVKFDKDWELSFEFENYPAIKKTVKAKDLFNLIAETAYKSAEPGVQFADQLRQGMMVHQIYEHTGDTRFQGVSSNACLPDFVVFKTKNSEKNMKHISVGDEVWTGKIFSKVVNKWYKGVKDVFEYVTDLGSFFSTEDHPVMCKGNIVSIDKADFIDTSSGDSIKILYSRFYANVSVYDIEVEDSEHIIEVNGFLVSNCSEKFLPPYSVCNLASINMEKFSTEHYIPELEAIVPIMVRMSDAVVDYELNNNLSPLPEQRWILEMTREIGCGITNIHGWLLKQNLPYDSDDGIKKVTAFFKEYARIVFQSSMRLGREKGSAPAFKMIPVDKFMGSTYFKNMVDTFYGRYPESIKYMRNLAHMSIAPVGSISNTFPVPCISSGIEPMVAPYYWRKTRVQDRNKYQYYFVIPNRILEYLRKNVPEDSEEFIMLRDFPGSVLDETGEIGKSFIKIFNKYFYDAGFKAAHDVDYKKKIKLMEGIYQWMDASISCTFNLPKTATVEDVKKIYMKAYQSKIRAVSVYVDESREGILLFEFPKESKSICKENRPVDIVYNCSPKRPEELPCDIHQVTVKGEKWIVLVSMLNGKPFEIFCGSVNDIYLPPKCQTGVIIKQGNGKYSLKVDLGRVTNVYENIADVLMSDNQKALTRLLSLNLRHGVYIQFIVDQLKKSKGDVTSFATAISRVLSKYVIDYVMKDNTCPVCGKSSLSFQEGCVKCIECEYSRC